MYKFIPILSIAVLLTYGSALAQCPTLGQNATFTSADCQPGSNPCALCPGDTYTLNATGTDLQAGDCINWYISDVPNFNPYNGQGTLLGCSELSAPPPDPCNPNPIFLGILVNACGTEENNEFFGMWSGGGFNVSDLTVSYPDPGNNGCGWQSPSPAVEAAVQNDCPGAVFVGPGEAVPGNVPVLVFTSSSADFDYNFGTLCATYGTVYVLQSACAPATEVFPNSGAGSASTSVSIGCWSEDITYNPAQVPNSNGGFVAEIPILGTIYGQAGCAWPGFPGLPGSDPIINIEPFEVTIPADQCNEGPYYIVGIYEPLPNGCPQTLTNYLSYDVPCPMPNLGTVDLCSNTTNYNLVQIQDPGVPAGAWSGDGVTGSTFNASGLSGAIPLTFTPTSPCGTPATTFINVSEIPTAMIDSVAPICPGGTTELVIHFTGTGPWSFNLLANGSPLGNFTESDNPVMIPIVPTSTTTYSVVGLTNEAGCLGPNATMQVKVSNNAPSAALSLVGNDSICAGALAVVSVDFTGGVPPYDFIYAINGIPQPAVQNITADPYSFGIPVTGNSVINLVSLADDNGCTGTVSGSAVVTTLPSPTATLVSDTTQMCVGGTDTLRINFTGNAPFIFRYRIDGVIQPQDTAFGNSIKIPIMPTGSTVVYTMHSVSDPQCTGTVSGIFQVNIDPGPTATISGSDTICTGQSSSVLINFTGTGPYTFNYTANNAPQTPITTSNNPYLLQVNPTQTTTYLLTSVEGGGCPGTVSGVGTVLVPGAPTGVVTGGGQICQGGNGTTVTFTFTGVGPFTFVHSINNVPQAPITTNLNVYTIQANPGIGTAYRLVSLLDGAGCTGTVSGVAQIFVFVPASAELSGDAVFCDTAATQVMVDFNGSGPFTIQYSIDNVPQPLEFTSDDPYFIPVNVNATTVYELLLVESPGCTGIPVGTATITVNYAPNYANLDLDCNTALNNYTVSFTVIGGTAPYTLVSGSGSFTGDVFTSNPITQGTGYSFVFHDANDCGDITVSGPSTCDCTTDAGTINLTPLNACANSTVSAIFNGGAFNDGSDTLMYIVHSNPALPLGTIYGWGATSTFGLLPGMVAGTTYYISSIAGNPNGAGQIDLTDPCLSVSQGVPVTFFNAPTADIGVGTFDICPGDSVTLNVVLSGTPPFSITPQFNGIAQPTISGITGGTYAYTFFPNGPMTVTIGSVADQFCANGTTTGSATIQVLPPPAFGPETVTCDYLTNTYTVSFAVTGTPPFNLSNMLATFNGTVFTSLPIPIGTPYFTFLTDNNNCGQDTLSGQGICDCLTDAGVMSQAQINVCQSATLTVPDTMGVVLEPGDQMMYIMHTNPGLPVGTILAWSTTPSFTFGGAMQAGVTYYISAIAGNPDGMGMIDLNDQCLDVADGTPVQWYPNPTATLTNGSFNICPGGAQALLVSLTGSPSYTLTYTSNSTPYTVFPQQNLFSINAQLQQTATYTLTSVTDSHGCVGTVSGQAVVTVHPTPQVANLIHNCDLDNQTYTLEFDVTTGDLSTTTVNNIPGTYDPASGHFTSDPIPLSQPFSFTVADSWMCGSLTVSDTVSCVCVTNAGNMAAGSLTLCAGETASTTIATGVTLEAGDTLVYLLVSNPTPASWTILSTSATPDFVFNPATMQYDVTYYIVAAAGNIGAGGINLNDPCFSSVSGVSVLWRAPVTASLAGADTICLGTMAMLPVNFTGNGPFSFTYSDGSANQVISNVSQNPYMLEVAPTVTSSYTLTGVSGAGACLGTVSGTADIQVNPLPQALNLLETCDFNTETYVLTFDIGNGAAPNGNYTIIGLAGALTDTTFTSTANPGAQPYTITISDEAGCSTTISGQPNCLCASDAGTLGNIQNACLPGGTVSAQSNGDSNLDADDQIRYFLCSDPAALPGSILAESAQPQFSFQAGVMTAGVIYYIVVGVGNSLAGSLDFSDPCLSLSSGFPVIFHDAPTALISDTLAVCVGSNAGLPVQFTGQGPFQFQYAINGIPQAQQTVAGNTTVFSNNIQQDQLFTLISVSDANCPGSGAGNGLIEAIPLPTGALAGTSTICLGDSALLTLNLSGADTFDVVISGGLTPILLNQVENGHTFAVTPDGNTTYQITNLQAYGNGCSPQIGAAATITTDQVTANATLSDYNGFNISCPNSTDGAINVTPQTGLTPFSASWSDGGSGLGRQTLAPGSYTVTLTDQLGCIWVDSFVLAAPLELEIVTEVTQPICFGQANGSISITNITGGPGPYQLFLNDDAQGAVDQLPYLLPRLESGLYTLGIEDQNGCISDVDIEVPSPLELYVDLGPDTTISFGDSLYMVPVHNSPQLDTFYWSPLDYLSTPLELNTWSRPPTSIAYSIYIKDEIGCEAWDERLIIVNKDKRVYIPNAINPQSTTLNDVITVWGGAEVARVKFMRIFDRWGELVFENQNFLPNDPDSGWRGQFRGDYVDPAVFVYVVEVEYINGETEIFKGDVTVVR